MPNRRVLQISCGLLLALVLPSLPIGAWDNEFADVPHLVANEIIWWALVAALLAHVHFVERRAWSSLGMRQPRWIEYPIALGAGVAMVVGLAAIYFVLLPALHLNEDAQVDALAATPFWWRFISVIRAAISEEVLFRGYALERIEELSGSRAFAAAFTCSVFAFAHVGSWGWAHLLIAGFGGAMLTVLYVWRRNLWVNIIAHWITDAASVLAG
jgi:membrane protease YdiL (CAAX protease family)